MFRLLRFLKHYIPECILAPLFKMLEASFELLVPLIMASIMDRGIGLSDKEHIIKMALFLLILAIVGLVTSITAQYFAAKAAVGFEKETKHALFSHIESLSFAELDRIGTSTMISRLTGDMSQVQNGINMVLRLFLRSPFVVLGAMIMAFTIDTEAAFVFVVIIPVLFLIVFGIMLITIPRFQKIRSALDHLLTLTRENVTGVRVIRAFHREEAEIEEFDSQNDFLTRLQLITGRISALMNPVTFILINVGIILILVIGADKVYTGKLTQGEVVALVNYMNQILVELVKFANLIILITKAYACGNRIQEVFTISSSLAFPDELDPSLNEDPSESVCFKHVGFTYNDAQDASLKDIDFLAKKGQTIGIIGGTGSGKTTLISLIGRFYDATDGTVSVDGIEVKQYPKEILRKKIGIVPQKAVLFKGSIRDNLLWGNEDASDEEISEAVNLAQAGDVLANKPEGLSSLVEQNGRNFSGGQRQRLTIARALVRKPEILILDDSSSALDYATDAALRKNLANLSYKPTVFVVSQRTASIRHADRILVLDDGEIVGDGTHDELLKNCEIYREIHASQFGEEDAV